MTPYKTLTEYYIYNQLVHPIKIANIGKVKDRTGLVVGAEEFDE